MRPASRRLALVGVGLAAVSCTTKIELADAHRGPAQVVAFSNLGSLDVRWTPIDGALGYRLYLSTNASWEAAGFDASRLPAMPTATSGGPALLVPIEGIPPGVTCYLAITARLAGNNATPPSAPIAVQVAPLAGSLGAAFWDESYETGSDFGTALDAGDLNGDGRRDLIVGDPSPYSAGTDDIGVVYGMPAGLSTNATGTRACGGFAGLALAAIGDATGDGFGDVLVGCPKLTYNPGSDGGVSFAPGSANGIPRYPVSTSPLAGIGATYSGGWAIAALGDVTGDGRADAAASDPGYGTSAPGFVVAYLGSNGGIKAGPQLTGAAGTHFGSSLAGVSGALVIGEPDAAGGEGRVHIARWNGGGFGIAMTLKVAGATRLGDEVANAGDVDGDGIPDLLVAGAPTSGGLGFAWLFLGSSGAPAWTPRSTPAWSRTFLPPTGGSIATKVGALHPVRWLVGAGDVDGDGFDDILVGEPSAGGDAGRVSLFLGGPSGPGARPVWSIEGQGAERLGDQVAGIGDFDGDGLADVAVSAPDRAVGVGVANITGRVLLFHGKRGYAPRVDAGMPAVFQVGRDGYLATPSFFDPWGPGPYRVTLNWGDGNSDGPIDGQGSILASIPNHRYAAPGVYVVRLRVTASDGRFGEGVTRVEAR